MERVLAYSTPVYDPWSLDTAITSIRAGGLLSSLGIKPELDMQIEVDENYFMGEVVYWFVFRDRRQATAFKLFWEP